MPRKVVAVPERLGVESISQVVEQVLPYSGSHDHFVFNLSPLKFIYPSGIVTLASLIAWLVRERACHVEMVSPADDDVQQYLCRMDFYRELGVEFPEDFRRYDATGRFREMVWLREERGIDRVATDLVRVVSADVPMNESLQRSLEYAIAEIASNVFHHAKSHTGGFLCAQKYRRHKMVEVAVADCGIGIRAAMSQVYQDLRAPESAGSALELAIQRGTTSRPDYNTGNGLFFTTEVIRANGGQAIIRSEQAVLTATADGNTITNRPYWQGTLVCLQFRLDAEADLTALFNQYYPPDEDFGLGSDFDELIPF